MHSSLATDEMRGVGAVADRAMRGTPGRQGRIKFSSLWAGLNRDPHSSIRWASSMALHVSEVQLVLSSRSRKWLLQVTCKQVCTAQSKYGLEVCHSTASPHAHPLLSNYRPDPPSMTWEGWLWYIRPVRQELGERSKGTCRRTFSCGQTHLSSPNRLTGFLLTFTQAVIAERRDRTVWSWLSKSRPVADCSVVSHFARLVWRNGVCAAGPILCNSTLHCTIWNPRQIT